MSCGHDLPILLDFSVHSLLKPKIYYKWSIFTNDDQIWEDKWKVKILFPTSIREVNRLKTLKNWDEWYKLRRRFLITRFLAVKLWARISLQVGDNSSVLFPHLFVNFHKINLLALRFEVKFQLTSILCSEFYGHDWPQTYRYKSRELWDLFAEVREKSAVR